MAVYGEAILVTKEEESK